MFPIKPIIPKKKSNILLIAGSCSVESKEQLFATLDLLTKSVSIDMLRCGIWKPRSSPHSFQGMGKKALPWLTDIESQYHIPVCIEVATPKHLEMAMTSGIQHFWIGARTSTNPFAVEEIAIASQGTDISMMIKNPVSPDLQLWYGNFERFAKVGIQKMAGIYRGFATGNTLPYRNDPFWQLLIEFKRTHHEIPLYCDPSHIAGKRDYIFDIAQKSLFLDVDGLMVEVHHNPNEALSDKEQQLSIPEFEEIINKLIIPSHSEIEDSTLKNYREQLDIIDKELILLLAKRFATVEQIAYFKKEHSIPILQINRWEDVRKRILSYAKEMQLNTDFVESMFNLIHKASIDYQEDIIQKDRKIKE